MYINTEPRHIIIWIIRGMDKVGVSYMVDLDLETKKNLVISVKIAIFDLENVVITQALYA